MKIGIVTSWNVKCGIAEYSRDLVYALKGIGHDVGVFALELPKEIIYKDEDFVQRGAFNLEGIDVIHFQNQGSFYSGSYLEKFLEKAKELDIKTIVTFHDSAVWDGFDFSNIDIAVALRPDVLENIPVESKVIIPMGMLYLPVRICSFGLGRNDDVGVQGVCDDLGFRYRVANPKENWLSQGELIEFLKSNDGVVLWYNEVGISGSSSAVKTALSSGRPVFINNCSWFRDIPNVKNLYRFDSFSQLKVALKDLENVYNLENCWIEIAKKHQVIYGGNNG